MTRINPRLDAGGWPVRKGPPSPKPFRTEEQKTSDGPADYALWLNDKVVGVVEAKRLTLGPQNVLTQSSRYSRGLDPKIGFGDYDGHRAPFLYSTNGEVTWFHDVRHPLNLSRRVADLHTAGALEEMLTRDFESECATVRSFPHDHQGLRPYQRKANEKVEEAISERKRNLLIAMATGTGKTFTIVNQVYRLMKAGVARRVLFLVDRRALAVQAISAFNAFEAEPGKKFSQVYDVFSSRLQPDDFDEDEKFDPTLLPEHYLTNPSPNHRFVYVATVQRIARNLFGSQVALGGDAAEDDDAGRLDIPIHAFDLVVADECHRGYTSQELSTWRSTLDHFDAIKIGLTATPAAHTVAYFSNKVFGYTYEEAVGEGHLVDYDAVHVHSDAKINGMFLEEGETVELVDRTTGLSKLDRLEDERVIDTGAVEREATSPSANLEVLKEVKKYADEHERLYGRFPKTLIFAVHDIPNISHANQLVNLARKVFERGDAFVTKITGAKDVDRPLQRIREFRNRPNPGIAVTVDLLATGVDIPMLEYIVFLRPVKSRILFEQMVGRGTRTGGKNSGKDHFTVFDCFDGTLLRYFKRAVSITAEAPVKASRTVAEIVSEIVDDSDRDYNVGCLVKRLQRVDKNMSADARESFAKFVPNGDLATFARALPAMVNTDFAKTMETLANEDFQKLLVGYTREYQTFIRSLQEETVTSVRLIRGAHGDEYKPEDYLQLFNKFVVDNPDHIDAVKILLDRPRSWSPVALTELRTKLAQSSHRFSVSNLQRAHEATYHKALIDVISMVKHAVKAEEPLLTSSERVERAFEKVTAGQSFSPGQQKWLDRIREHLRANLSIGREDFEAVPILNDPGGWSAALKVFDETKLDELIHAFNEAIAA